MEHKLYRVYRDTNLKRNTFDAIEKYGATLSEKNVESLCWDDDGSFYAYEPMGTFDNLADAITYAETIPVSTTQNWTKLIINFVWIEDEIFEDEVDGFNPEDIEDVCGKRMVWVESGGETLYVHCAPIELKGDFENA